MPVTGIALYNEAISVRPDYAPVYYNLGVVLSEQAPQKRPLACVPVRACLCARVCVCVRVCVCACVCVRAHEYRFVSHV